MQFSRISMIYRKCGKDKSDDNDGRRREGEDE